MLHHLAAFLVDLYVVLRAMFMLAAFGFIALAVGTVLWDSWTTRWYERKLKREEKSIR